MGRMLFQMLRPTPHDGDAAFHVVGPQPIEPVALPVKFERRVHTIGANCIQMGIQENGPVIPRASDQTDHIISARGNRLDVRFKP